MKSNYGYIYVLSNPSFKENLIKIGISKDLPTSRRIHELNSTGLPTPFECEYFAFVSDYENLERVVHKLLRKDRVTRKREFFSTPIPDAIALIREKSRELIDEVVFFRTAEELEKIRLNREHEWKAKSGALGRKIKTLETKNYLQEIQERRKKRTSAVRLKIDEFLEEKLSYHWSEQMAETYETLKSKDKRTKIRWPLTLLMFGAMILNVAFFTNDSIASDDWVGVIILTTIFLPIMIVVISTTTHFAEKKIFEDVQSKFSDARSLLLYTANEMYQFLIFEEEWELLLANASEVVEKRFVDALKQRHNEIINGQQISKFSTIFE